MTTTASPSQTSLYLNAFDKNIQVDGIIKTIDDGFWTKEIVPILYPLWDSDKDKLEVFVKYKDGTAKMNKTKYQRNQKTGTYKWISYQFDLDPFMPDDVDQLYTKLKEKFTEYRVGQENDLEKALAARYAKDNILNWAKLRLIRNFLLLDSDWSQLGDAPLTDAEKAKWVTYRQKLRDVPTDNGEVAEPATVVFPVTPFKHAEMDDGKEYLSDTIEHFYTMNQTVYSRFSSRLVNYLTLTIGTTAIDKMPLSRLTNVGLKAQPTTGDNSLDALLKFIEEGEE
tara:strand:+ start:2440 stop:3285 length:846 start_codon:yes stop_codon:yes gene_type:complete